MINFFTFDGKKSRDYGVYISGPQVYNAPERDESDIEIPGRNGKLTIDNGRYKNQTWKYPAFIIHDFGSNVEGLRNYLLSKRGYQRFEDTYHPQEYRLAKFVGPFEAEPEDAHYAAKFDLLFDFYPQRFLKSGEQSFEITGASSIYNPYSETAKPLIRAYGTGTFSIGGVSVQITAADTYTDIDCDLEEAYKDNLATNKNPYVKATTYPELKPGTNAVALSGITKLVITPRWWIL